VAFEIVHLDAGVNSHVCDGDRPSDKAVIVASFCSSGEKLLIAKFAKKIRKVRREDNEGLFSAAGVELSCHFRRIKELTPGAESSPRVTHSSQLKLGTKS
jgi:hypothetical protein